ncbi:hypothetical protein [Mangrovimicrobium sediminis]|uniref:hypothetical protein n=1 Tax=Mangrovimicrobium sediminis TaxID=2562682 RepID=UPI0014369311|nr:hypothetical protein [Haliea sp. SAOS-164]
MYINRMLVLGMTLALVSFPMFTDWLARDYTAWERYYVVWLLVILFSWWGNRSRHPDEL